MVDVEIEKEYKGIKVVYHHYWEPCEVCGYHEYWWITIEKNGEKLAEFTRDVIKKKTEVEIFGRFPRSRGHKKKLYKQLREKLGLSKKEFSEMMGIVGGFISWIK